MQEIYFYQHYWGIQCNLNKVDPQVKSFHRLNLVHSLVSHEDLSRVGIVLCPSRPWDLGRRSLP